MSTKAFFLTASIILAHVLPSFSEEKEFVYDSQGRRDPFVPLLGESLEEKKGILSPRDLYVEGIILDPVQGSMAVLNGKVLREGDLIGSYKIKSIEKNAVYIINEDGETFRLNFQTRRSKK